MNKVIPIGKRYEKLKFLKFVTDSKIFNSLNKIQQFVLLELYSAADANFFCPALDLPEFAKTHANEFSPLDKSHSLYVLVKNMTDMSFVKKLFSVSISSIDNNYGYHLLNKQQFLKLDEREREEVQVVETKT
jgi:hypothetical protein